MHKVYTQTKMCSLTFTGKTSYTKNMFTYSLVKDMKDMARTIRKSLHTTLPRCQICRTREHSITIYTAESSSPERRLLSACMILSPSCFKKHVPESQQRPLKHLNCTYSIVDTLVWLRYVQSNSTTKDLSSAASVPSPP